MKVFRAVSHLTILQCKTGKTHKWQTVKTWLCDTEECHQALPQKPLRLVTAGTQDAVLHV